MKVSFVAVASLSGLLLSSVCAYAADPIPDMKGRWMAKSHSIVAGHGGHWPSGKGTFEKPALVEKNVVWEVKGQEDRRFWGVLSLTEGSERTEEPFIGQLSGKDSKKLLLTDTDGYTWGELDGDTFTYCYAHAGGKTQSNVISCSEAKRAK
jgi:hypothetical protein